MKIWAKGATGAGTIIATAASALWVHRLGLSVANSWVLFFSLLVAVPSAFVALRQLWAGEETGNAAKAARPGNERAGASHLKFPGNRLSGQAAAESVWRGDQPLAKEAHRAAAPDAPQPARRAVASLRAGLALALLAAIAGIVSNFLGNAHEVSAGASISQQSIYGVPAAAAAAAFVVRGRRESILPLLLGMWWSSAAWIVWDITAADADRLFAATSRAFAGSAAGIMSDALGLAAAILVLVAWRPAPEARTRNGPRVLLVLLLFAVACTQLGEYVLLTNMAPVTANYAQAGALLITCVTAAWYATALRARVPCGLLLIGWALHKLLWLTAELITAPSRAGLPASAGIFACLAAVAVIITAIAYITWPPLSARPNDKTQWQYAGQPSA